MIGDFKKSCPPREIILPNLKLSGSGELDLSTRWAFEVVYRQWVRDYNGFLLSASLKELGILYLFVPSGISSQDAEPLSLWSFQGVTVALLADFVDDDRWEVDLPHQSCQEASQQDGASQVRVPTGFASATKRKKSVPPKKPFRFGLDPIPISQPLMRTAGQSI